MNADLHKHLVALMATTILGSGQTLQALKEINTKLESLDDRLEAVCETSAYCELNDLHEELGGMIDLAALAIEGEKDSLAYSEQALPIMPAGELKEKWRATIAEQRSGRPLIEAVHRDLIVERRRVGRYLDRHA